MASKCKNLEDEYEVAQITEKYLSDECYTPDSLPRPTQVTFGKHLIRIDGKSNYPYQKIYVHPRVLDRWADTSRGSWVDKVGTNDYFIHELARKTNKYKTTYAPQYPPFKRLFPRPYSCEYDVVDRLKLDGLKNIENKYRPAVSMLSKMIKQAKKIEIGEFEPPFWWEVYKKQAQRIDPCLKEVPELEEEKEPEQLRWKPVPSAATSKTICERRKEMNKVGLLFRGEACNFYYNHYPAPTLNLFRERFVK